MYSKTNWVDGAAGNTPITSLRLNKLEKGVGDAHDLVAALDETLTTAIGVAQTTANSANEALSDPDLLINKEKLLQGVDDFLAHYTVVDDGTTTANWPNRLSFQFAGHLTGWFGEYGELRATPAKDNTVGLRVFTRDQDTDARSTTIPVMEVVKSRNVRTPLFGVMGDGLTYATAIEVRPPNGPVLKTGYLRIVGNGAPPAGTPAGTLIIRTAT